MLEKEKNNKEHWNKVYSSNEVTNLGWYEDNPEASFKLIRKCILNKDDTIIDIGTGASSLIDKLLENGYKNIIATDISEIALEKLKLRAEKLNSTPVRYLTEDLSSPSDTISELRVDLWHDRTLLHFLITEEHREDI